MSKFSQLAGTIAAVVLVVPAAVSGRGDDPRDHWAFLPPVSAPVPVPDGEALAGRIRTPVDAFVYSALGASGIRPSEEADPRTLIRRITYDLTGLPPTYDEIEAFVADDSDSAYETLVDRLLESPAYGERWGRHWLDVARYADTVGYLTGGRETRFPYSFTYRDWVINALNDDLPYDQFLRYQIAADHYIELAGEERGHLAALGFLTVGRQFLGRRTDIIDDQIDVVTRGALGLTVSCARCHDHKSDPIPTADYYSLFGVFDSTHVPGELPVIAEAPPGPDLEAFLKGKADHDEKIRNFYVGLRDASRSHDSLVKFLKGTEEGWDAQGETLRDVARKYSISRRLLERWIAYLKNPPEGGETELFSSWLAAASPRDEKLHQDTARAVAEALAGDDPLGNALNSGQSPTAIGATEFRRFMDREDENELRKIEAELVRFTAKSAGAPSRAMVVADKGAPSDAAIAVRGNPDVLGDVVPRQFLEILSPVGDRAPFRDGSGRRELAEAVVDRSNPLTARVMVNRVWMHHFGRPLVSTPSDFGVTCPPPRYQDLLDYLAVRFMDDGWSLKNLHRLMVNSSVYRASSAPRPDLADTDPENDLFARMAAQRLGFEGMRDSVLFVTGQLDKKMGGRPVELDRVPSPPRRTVYGFVDRQDLPPVFRTFDFASPDAHTPERIETTVPQQALFVMNSPFVIEAARRVASAGDGAGPEDGEIIGLYRRLLGRDPEPAERSRAATFLRSEEAAAVASDSVGWSYGFGGIRADGSLDFETFPHFENGTFAGGASLPDQILGWASINQAGGHPDKGERRSVIRRWTAPVAGRYSLEGILNRPSEHGDGIRGRVMVEGRGIIGEWEVLADTPGRETRTTLGPIDLGAGQSIAMAVDCRGDVGHDSFHWRVEIADVDDDGRLIADSVADFYEPEGLTPLERLAHVLLSTNEFAYVD